MLISRAALVRVSGRLEDGMPVIGGWFYLVDTHGLAPDEIVHEMKKHGMVLDGKSFIDDAVRAGWNKRTAVARLGL